jgi:hypothetical protein
MADQHHSDDQVQHSQQRRESSVLGAADERGAQLGDAVDEHKDAGHDRQGARLSPGFARTITPAIRLSTPIATGSHQKPADLRACSRDMDAADTACNLLRTEPRQLREQLNWMIASSPAGSSGSTSANSGEMRSPLHRLTVRTVSGSGHTPALDDCAASAWWTGSPLAQGALAWRGLATFTRSG